MRRDISGENTLNTTLNTAAFTDITGYSKCTTCVDEHIKDSSVVVADAITLVPVVQVLNLSMGVVATVVALPICLEHRRQQVEQKSGLVTV